MSGIHCSLIKKSKKTHIMHISNKTILNNCIFNILKICNFGGRHVIVGISKGEGLG